MNNINLIQYIIQKFFFVAIVFAHMCHEECIWNVLNEYIKSSSNYVQSQGSLRN